ncbi:hypothetical protein FEM48_Zijuj01G0170900 [Ziziphus jujuba var. spinosa]|uniref:Uncharacterized protein n=1 Tax=Ziziphus jujuba var. spinosa TaxID=714518 RepID=A0A978W2H5_ZIZJJ|nr:hypothetical protein FEM48_Zijuj01G0170900 [Ziziphus jujuba var. spinosa]
MKIKLLTWLFFIVVFLVATACQSAFTTESGNHATLEQEKRIKNGYETIGESSSIDYQGAYETENNEVHPSRISRRAKAIYGGANDLKRPRKAKNGSSSFLLKSNPFIAVLRHVAAGLLVSVLLF